MNLDVPLFGNFHDSLSGSIENFCCFENARQNYDMMLCNVLHGGTFKELITWYDAVKDFDFDGCAIGVEPASNVYLQLLAYLLLYDNDSISVSHLRYAIRIRCI
jgi:queuine/archaeosine tRNA-ribosyltransferase